MFSELEEARTMLRNAVAGVRAYAAVVELPAGASDDEALLAYLGRRPEWAA